MSNAAMSEVQANELAIPTQDKLGLALDSVFLSSRETDDGSEFVLAHTRPFLGESMLTLLNTIAPYRHTHWNRRHAAMVFTPAEELHHRMDRPGREFSDEMETMHSRVSRHGIGVAFLAFGDEVRRDWAEAFGDTETDTVYTPLSSLSAYANFSTLRDWQIDRWVPDQADYEGFDRVRPVRVAEMINDIYGSSRLDGPVGFVGSDAGVDQNIREFVESLDESGRDRLVGQALSSYEEPGRTHWPAHNLVLDLANQRHWYSPLYRYGGFDVGVTDELEFPVPLVEFGSERSVTISNLDGVVVELGFGEAKDDVSPSPWTIESYALPDSYYSSGRYATLAWERDDQGNRRFLDQAGTVEAVRQTELPIAGTPDSYLGKLLLRYFRQPEEQTESVPERKWVTEMGLPGSSSKRHITQRELPVWIQLPQHQTDLLSSKFIQAAELAAE